jgi:FkbM family methyltransferase
MPTAITTEISPNFLALAKRVLPQNPIICDVGSRDGQEAILLFKELRAGGLHVFEPNPSAAETCRRNLAHLLGGYDSVCVFNQVAVSDTIGQLKFYPVNAALSENKDIGFSSMFPINPEYTKRRGRIVQNEVIVQSITLDQYFKDKLSPDLLWVDVEGAELNVLRGGGMFFRTYDLFMLRFRFGQCRLGSRSSWKSNAISWIRGFASTGS